MYKYQNVVRTAKKKQKEAYLQKLFESSRSKHYRWSLDSLIGKSVCIESLTWSIEDIDFSDDDATDSADDFHAKEILLKDAHLISADPPGDELFPIILDHLWIMVGSDFCPDQEYSKIRVTGTVNQYVRQDGTKNIGIDATRIRCSNGTLSQIAAQTENEKENKKMTAVCPKVFENLILSEEETNLLGYMYLYELLKDISIISRSEAKLENGLLTSNFAELFGGAFQFHRKFTKIYNMRHWREVGRFLSEHTRCEHVAFDICALSENERKEFASLVNYISKEHHYEHTYLDVAESIAAAPSINLLNKQELDGSVLNILQDGGYITIKEMYLGTYEQELAAYNVAMEKRQQEIEKIKKEHPELSSDLKFDIPEPPVNHDMTYYIGIPTEKGQTLCDWLGIPIVEQQIPNFDNQES